MSAQLKKYGSPKKLSHPQKIVPETIEGPRLKSSSRANVYILKRIYYVCVFISKYFFNLLYNFQFCYQCSYDGGFTCSGTVVPCAIRTCRISGPGDLGQQECHNHNAACRFPNTGWTSCIAGGGDCGGYFGEGGN